MEAINSVINQSSENWVGILILDGAADKKTKEVFQNFEHPKFEKFAFKKNQGPYGTRAKAVELSNSEWYYQLDCDDLLPNDAVESVLRTIESHPDAEFVYGDCEYFSNQLSIIKKPKEDQEFLCISPLFNGHSPIKKSLYRKIGGYCEDLFINADWDFWLSVHENNIKGAYTDNKIYKRRQRFNNVGHEHIEIRQKIIERIIKRHPIYFCNEKRKNKARFHVYQNLARHYRMIGNRKNASKYAREALKYGNSIPVFDTIFQEEKMTTIRYKLRRLGRYV